MLIERCSESVVAIDLGSNSFHLLEATINQRGRLQPVNALARKVQLGLDMADGQLTNAAIQRGLDCVSEFAQYTQGQKPSKVRVVGTQALRLAENRRDFILPASEILGQSIELVSGEQEAELAYSGVSTELESKDSRLVVDIGGGSTELVVGCGDDLGYASSVAVGCVSWLQYFPGGVISEQGLADAQGAAGEQFSTVRRACCEPWRLAVGCSGTLLAVERVLVEQGWSAQGICSDGLQHLRAALLNFDLIDAVKFHGLSERRRSIFASGVAIVLALFDSLNIDAMTMSQAGLREGVAWRLLKALN